MIVSLFLLIGDVDVDEIGILRSRVSKQSPQRYLVSLYLHVVHLHDLLLVCTLRFVLAMIKRGLGLLPPALDLLASSIVPALSFLQVAIRQISLPLQLHRIFCVTFPYLLVSRGQILEWVCDLYDKL